VENKILANDKVWVLADPSLPINLLIMNDLLQPEMVAVQVSVENLVSTRIVEWGIVEFPFVRRGGSRC
jgi:hypothetical protein